MKPRPGYALAELATALALLGLICAACAVLVHAQAIMLENVSERAARAETLRTARNIASGELRGVVLDDIRASARDSIALRVFRGRAIVCATAGTRATMRYRGLRDPDETKDSLLVVESNLVVTVENVTNVAGGCRVETNEKLISLTASQPLRNGDLVMVFETGSYFLSSNALRYRRSTEGRQPLTDEVIDHRSSMFVAEPNQRTYRIVLRSTPGTRMAADLSDTRVRLLNATE